MKTKLTISFGLCMTLLCAGTALAAPLEVKGWKVTVKKWRIGEAKGKHYVDVQFQGKVGEGLDEKAMYRLKAECKVGSDEVVDESMILGSTKLKDMKSGQSTKLNSLMFGIKNALDKKPDQCTLTVTSQSGFGANKKVDTLATACWKGKGATDGACSK